jgi:hypothetical protein
MTFRYSNLARASLDERGIQLLTNDSNFIKSFKFLMVNISKEELNISSVKSVRFSRFVLFPDDAISYGAASM